MNGLLRLAPPKQRLAQRSGSVEYAADQLAFRRIDENAIQLGRFRNPAAPSVSIDVDAETVGSPTEQVTTRYAVIGEPTTVDHVVNPNETVCSSPQFNYVELRLGGRETETVGAAQVACDHACLTRFPIDPVDVLR